SKTASPKSPKPNGSATAYPASTATSAPSSNSASSTAYKPAGSSPLHKTDRDNLCSKEVVTRGAGQSVNGSCHPTGALMLPVCSPRKDKTEPGPLPHHR